MQVGVAKVLNPDQLIESLTALPEGLEQRRFVGVLLVRGFSAAAIDLKFYDRYAKRLDRNWLDKVHRKVHSSGKLKRISERAEEQVLTSGLALKAERVRRLTEYVETIEGTALSNPGKTGIEYRRGIQQIKEEVEGLGLDVTIHPSDAFGQLLLQIRELGERAINVGQTDTGTGTPDAGTSRSDSE